ncbi:MAG: hypothetical protein VX278_04570, partial [Myxococcota bacterium]|nr:hypothetical protein [Myxococcota bacterium]
MVALLLTLFLCVFPGNAQEPKPPPIDPEDLRSWWKAAGELRMGESAYRVEDLNFSEGVCSLSMKGGIMIPVYTGIAPVSERMVGFLYVGDGALSVSFPKRADAWSFSNHMHKRAKLSYEELLPIAMQQKPYTVSIDRGMILSADPSVPKMIYNLEPVGGGVFFEEKEDGEVDATYIVTEGKGKFQAQFVATNLLADRADYLERIGIDPRAMIRQDRLMHETLGFPGFHLRSVADFRTKQRFHVAAQEGTVVDTMAYDRWLTCFRDGRDESNTGFKAMAFAHGFDSDKRRHFQRFSGISFEQEAGEEPPRPSLRMEPVFADSTIEFEPARGGTDKKITVDSVLTLRAHGGPLQYVAMQLPTDGARIGTWTLEQLETDDGSMSAWAGLNSDLFYASLFAKLNPGQTTNDLNNNDLINQMNNVADTQNSGADLGSQGESGNTTEGGMSGGGVDFSAAERIEADNPFAATQLPVTEQQANEQEINVYQESGFIYKILAILPEPVPEGKEIKIHLKWSAELPFANLSRLETAEGINVRSRGTTTGMRSYLPDLLPSPGGTKWNFRTKVGASGRYGLLRSQRIAASGTTSREWQDEGLWNWIETNGREAISPSVGLGRWKVYTEPRSKGMPAVRVNMFPKSFSYAQQVPSEVRRVVSFLQRFLPSYSSNEVEVVEDSNISVLQARYNSRRRGIPGLVRLQRFSVTGIGRTGGVREENPYEAQTQIASQIASQYWGQLLSPNSYRDDWIRHAIPDAYAGFYLRGAYGAEQYFKNIDALRKKLENPKTIIDSWKTADAKKRSYSLTGATPYSDVPLRVRQDYGFYVFAEMLRLRIGNQAFFKALDDIAELRKNKRVTTEQIQSQIEKVSGQSLNDFFDFWIHGGRIPSIKVTTRADKNKDGKYFFGCIESDLPFGILEVPIRIHQKKRATDA